jgi:tRNA(Ile)-lysidine synthase
MLTVTRAEIREYAKDNGLSWLEDRSNKDSHYLRNRIRLEILPLLETIQPQLVTHLSGLSALAGEWRDWLGAELEDSLSKLDYTLQDSGVVWSLPVWRRLPQPLKRAVVKRAFYELFPDQRLELTHMERILRAAVDNTARIQLPGGGYLIIRGQRMEIRMRETPQETVPFLIPLNVPGETFCPGGKLVARWISREELPENWRHIPGEEAYFNVESLETKLFLRNRRHGDRIRLFGRSGTERLKKLLIDWKIPQESRNSVPLLVDEDDQIWWVVGLRRGEAGRITPQSNNIMHLKYIRSE